MHFLSKKHTCMTKALFFVARRPPAVFFHQTKALFEQKTHFYDKKLCSSSRGGLRQVFPTQKEHFLNRKHTFMTKSPVLRRAAASGGFFPPKKSTF